MGAYSKWLPPGVGTKKGIELVIYSHKNSQVFNRYIL